MTLMRLTQKTRSVIGDLCPVYGGAWIDAETAARLKDMVHRAPREQSELELLPYSN